MTDAQRRRQFDDPADPLSRFGHNVEHAAKVSDAYLPCQANVGDRPVGSPYILKMELNQRIRAARDAKGLTQQQVADHFGMARPSVTQWELGTSRPEQGKLAGLAALFGVSLDWLLTGEGGGPVVQAQFVDTQPVDPIPRQQLMGARDFPIYASAEGGAGQIIRSVDPIDFQPRPAILERVKDAYGLIVTGESMYPEYRSGDTALVNPHLPPMGGEVHIFYAEQHGEARASIKELRRATQDKWLVTQHNPQKDFALSRAEWRWAHRVLGKYSRR